MGVGGQIHAPGKKPDTRFIGGLQDKHKGVETSSGLVFNINPITVKGNVYK
jgi:hypothetical protein